MPAPSTIPDEAVARGRLLDAVRRLDALGLNLGTSGNASVRLGDGVLVTPSGIPADRTTAADLVRLDADGTPAPGQAVPTSEWRIHVDLLADRPDVTAVVHTHSPEATAAAVVGRPVPAVHYAIARVGAAQIPCADYATYGTPELSAAVRDALAPDLTACLMANHGAIAVGTGPGGLDAAVALAADLEWLCGVHRRAVQLGDPTILDDDEIARVADRFRGYGQR